MGGEYNELEKDEQCSYELIEYHEIGKAIKLLPLGPTKLRTNFVTNKKKFHLIKNNFLRAFLLHAGYSTRRHMLLYSR